MSILHNSFFTFTGKIAQVVSTFVVGIMIARTIGPEGNGFYELFQLIVIFSVTLGTLGIGHANVFVVKRKNHDQNQVISTIFTLGLIWGIVLAGIIYGFYSIFPKILPGISQSVLLAGSLLIPFSLLDSYLIQGFLVDLRIKTQSLLIILKNALLIASMFFWVYLLGQSQKGIVAAIACTYILNVLFIYISLKRYYLVRLYFNKQIFKDAFIFGIKNWIGNVFLILNYKFNLFLVNYLLTVSQVGLYSIAVTLASSLLLIPSSIGPILYSTWSGQSDKEMDASTPRMVRQILFITFGCAFILAILGSPIIHVLYGNQYEVSYTPLLLLLPGVLMMTVNYVLFNNFASRGKPQFSAYILIASLCVNIILNFLFIPSLGIKGAALSNTISYTVSAITSLVLFRRINKSDPLSNLVFPTRSDIVQIMQAVKHFLSQKS